MTGYYDIIVIGAGPAGMAAAISAREHGAENVLIVDRNAHLGGILKQCIHEGFGLLNFKQSLTGPEYAARYAKMLKNAPVEVLLNAIAIKITKDREVFCVTRDGIKIYRAKAIILATGCRERTRGMISLPGTRPAGIYTAGVIQRLINIQNVKPGTKAVVLGSGDIGMIMARRMMLEGMSVDSVLEKLPVMSGLLRNKVRCLDDFDIPLFLCRTIIDVQGDKRLERVVAASVDESGNAISGTEYMIECDTLVLSVGLIPENELAKSCGIDINAETGGPAVNDKLETSISGIFSAGNSLHVHSLADYASDEGGLAGKYAAEQYI